MRMLLACTLAVTVTASAQTKPLPEGYWPESKSNAILAKTETIRLAPDLSSLTPQEQAALKDLLQVGAIMQKLYEVSRHHEALTALDRLRVLDVAIRSSRATCATARATSHQRLRERRRVLGHRPLQAPQRADRRVRDLRRRAVRRESVPQHEHHARSRRAGDRRSCARRSADCRPSRTRCRTKPQARARRHPGRRLRSHRRLRPGARHEHGHDPAERSAVLAPLRPHDHAAREHHAHPDIFAADLRIWRAAVADAHANDLLADGNFQRTLWHEIGHYLGVDRDKQGRTLDVALEDYADSVEEMKADLVSLFALHRMNHAALRAIQAAASAARCRTCSRAATSRTRRCSSSSSTGSSTRD
jgi:hypothetical protein